MGAAMDHLSGAFAWLWQSSVQGAILVAVILAVQWVFRRRLTPQWRYALWGVLLVRLVLVWSPSTPFSVYNLAPEPASPPAPVAAFEPAVSELPPRAPEVASEESSVSSYPPAVGTGAPTEDVSAANAVPGSAPPGGEAVLSTTTREGGASSGITSSWRLGPTLGALWLLGLASLLFLMALQSLQFSRKVRAGRLVTDTDTLDRLETCRRKLGLGTYVALVETDCVTSPALLGCVRPKLVVPPGFLDGLSHDDARYIFLHELAHVKRGDIWTSWLFNLVLALHWFNPAIWYARRRFIVDRETACDAHVLAALDAPAQRQYGHTILNLTQRFSSAPWAPGMAGISESNSNLKRRIAMIKDYRTPTRLAAWSGVGLCLLIALATLTNAQENTGSSVDIESLPTDIYAYTATNGGTMIAVQLLNQSDREQVVDVEFWEGAPDTGKKIGRGGLAIAPGMTGTEAIPWPVSNGAYDIHVRIDPDNAIAETDESNNVVRVEIRYKNGRFSLHPVRDGRAGTSPFRPGAGEQQALAAELEHVRVLKARVVEFLNTDGPLPDVEPFQPVHEAIAADPKVQSGRKEIQQLEAKMDSLDEDTADYHREQGNKAFLSAALRAVEGEVRRDALARLRVELVEKEAALMSQMQRPFRQVDQRASAEAGAPPGARGNLSACQNNLKQLGLVFKMYASESKGGVFPVLSQEGGRLMFAWGGNNATLGELPVLSTEFASEGVKLTVCPATEGTTDLPDDDDYVYLGYLLQSDADVHDFATAYGNEASKGSAWANGLFVNDLPSPKNDGTVIYRIREGVERSIITDINNPAGSALAQSRIPTMIEWPDHHESGESMGGNVLFMDGHVEFMKYPGKWPMTEETIGTLKELAGRNDSVSETSVPGVSEKPNPDASEPRNFMEEIVVGIGRAVDGQLRADCQNNMKQLGLALKIYASETPGEFWPPLSRTPRKLMFNWGGADGAHDGLPALSTDYLKDPAVVGCPAVPEGLAVPDDRDFFYLGYVMRNDADVRLFAEKYRAWLEAGGDSDFWIADDKSRSPDDGLTRIREGVERFVVTDINDPAAVGAAQSNIPVVIERPVHHQNRKGALGSNILYMDGHVEFRAYPGEWPMTEETIGILTELAGREPVAVGER